MSVNFDRRSFLKGSAAVSGGLALPNFVVQAAEVASGKKIPVYGTWKDIYKSQWTWDKVVRSTHHLNCWYQAHCSWDVYVKDGLVYREEQAAEYPQVNAALPDFNPRGCQKGGCFSERMYDPTRISHPLRRVGERGSGKWERVTWKEALDDIADTYLDVTVNEGTDTHSLGFRARYRSRQRHRGAAALQPLTQSVSLDMNSDIGDSHRGAGEMFGKISVRAFCRRLLLLRPDPDLGGNPLYTQIPNAHFYTRHDIAAPRSFPSAPTTTPRRSSPTCGFRSSPAPTPRWRYRSVARLSREAMSTKPSSRTRPTCRCWCAATRGCSSPRPTCRPTAGMTT
jgi:hypothetical protein